MALLDRESFSRRRVASKPVECQLEDGSTVLIRRPTGRDYRDWKRLIRNDDGSFNAERYDVSEEVWCALLLVDADGAPLLAVGDVFNGTAFDGFPLDDLNRIKAHIDALVGERVLTDEERAKNLNGTTSSES